jgi:hypothetical protein
LKLRSQVIIGVGIFMLSSLKLCSVWGTEKLALP